MIKYVVIISFLFINFLFENYCPGKSTGWSVFYFGSLYMCMGILCLEDLFKNGRLTRKIYSTISVLIFIRAGYEFSLVNLPYEEYYLAANSELSTILFASVTIVFFAILIINNHRSWVKNLKNIGK
jgi:UDP-N-acetylmuramyl pentapeptide phosphotransferase/UDP-N-acetylglucosamine-1-phosphate transferase